MAGQEFDVESLPPLPDSSGAFAARLYFYATGLRPGEHATIRGENGDTILSYRAFASIVGVVAGLVAAIVAVAGLAGTALLVAEGAPFRAGAALALTALFVFFIVLLVPKTKFQLQHEGSVVLSVSQTSLFPATKYTVTAPDGSSVGELRRGLLARIGRERWTIHHEGAYVGEASEASLLRAWRRRIAGKFSRRWQTDLVVEHGAMEAARIHRRPDTEGRTDYLEITSDLGDRRIAVALATLLFGGEP